MFVYLTTIAGCVIFIRIFFSQKGVAIFYSVVAIPCLAGPFTLKAAELSVSVLQPSQHCCNL
jgi:hypothetical protein